MAKSTQKKAAKSKPKRPIGRRAPDRTPTKIKNRVKMAARSVPQRGEGRGSNGRAMAKVKGEVRAAAPLPPIPMGHVPGKPVKNQAGLKSRDLEFFRDLLIAKRRELLGDVHSMEEEALRSASGSNLSNLPIHIADMAVYLASDELSGYVTGQVIEVNGGQYMP